MSFWKKCRYRLEWIAVRTLAFLIPLLPRRGAHWLAQGLGNVAYLCDSRGRRTALENLEAVYGDKKTEKERKKIARRSFQHFARTIVDQFWSPRLTAESFDRYCELTFEDSDAIESAKETGAIWVTPHYSNFEWVGLAMGFRGCCFTVIAQDFKNPLLTGIFQRNRQVSGHQVIPQKGALFRLLKNLKARGHAAFLTDLNIRPSKAATIIECLGFKTCVTAMHAELMKRTRLPVIPGLCIPQPDGTYQIRGFSPIRIEEEMTHQEIAQACWEAFEPFIRENPEPWLWMYKHWRFRPKEGGEHYPPYAGSSKAFNKMEKRLAEESAAKHDSGTE